MPRFKTHTELGWRWIACGWRLFSRNPWLLGGMGACAVAALLALAAIPLIGSPLVGLLVPALLGSFYLAVDGVARHKAPLPPALRAAAIRQAPGELLNVVRVENGLMHVVLLGFYGLVVTVLADIVVWLAAGTAWVNRSLDLHISALPAVAGAGLILLAIYLALGASLVYTLPLVLLQNQPLSPAMRASLVRSGRYGAALLVILALPAAPLLLGALVSLYSPVIGYVAGFALGAAALPVAACAFYCSYRTVFPLPPAEPGGRAAPKARPA